jgi:hypothetical protein
MELEVHYSIQNKSTIDPVLRQMNPEKKFRTLFFQSLLY